MIDADHSGQLPDTVLQLPDVNEFRLSGRIGLLTGPRKYRSLVDRQEGYLDALTAHEIPADPSLMPAPTHHAGGQKGYQQMLQLLDTERPPTAVVAISDKTAFGALEALKERGLQIPRDMALVSIDGPLSSYVTLVDRLLPPLVQRGLSPRIHASLLLARANTNRRLGRPDRFDADLNLNGILDPNENGATTFQTGGKNFLRFNLATPQVLLEEGLGRIRTGLLTTLK